MMLTGKKQSGKQVGSFLLEDVQPILISIYRIKQLDKVIRKVLLGQMFIGVQSRIISNTRMQAVAIQSFAFQQAGITELIEYFNRSASNHQGRLF